jgi:hypothetical protein
MPLPDDNPYAPPTARGIEPPVLAQPVEETESVLRVDYHLTLEDLVEFNFYHQSNSSPMRRRMWFIRGLGLAGIAFGGLWTWLTMTRQADMGMAGAIAIVVGSAVFLVASTASRRRANLRKLLEGMFREGRNENLFGLHRAWVSPRGIRRISRFVDATFQWQAVEKIAASPHAVYIYDSAASAIIVPRSAFGDEAEFQRFLETAQKFWRQAVRK